MISISPEGIKKVLYIIIAVLALLGTLFVGPMIYGLIVGSVAKVATDGSVPVSSAMNTSISGMETTYIATVDTTLGNTTLAVSLLAIVVIMVVFNFYTNGKKSREGGMA